MQSQTSLSGSLPELIHAEPELENLLTRPSMKLTEFISTLDGPLMILGAGGKMGPTLAVLAKRAAEMGGSTLEVIAVSRFSNAESRAWLEERRVRTIACDLLDAAAVAQLPDAPNVISLVGLKFGTAQNPAATWALNTLVPANIGTRYAQSRLVALSTGNVYPFSEVSRGGSVETDPLTPVGEYANAAIARERLFEYFAGRHGTPLALLRLFYAVELRYGVLVDIARKVQAGEPIHLANSHACCIWQGDANDMILRSLSLASAPPAVFNLCRPETFRVRNAAEHLGHLLGKAPVFSGEESNTALLGNASRICQILGEPSVQLMTLMRWVAHWVNSGGRNLGRPTHFETRDGRY